LRHRGIKLREPPLDASQHAVGRLAPVGPEEVDGVHLGEAGPQLGQPGFRLGTRLLRRLVRERLREITRLLGYFFVVRIPRAVEQCPDVPVGHAVNQPSLEDHRVSTAVLDLAQEPLEVFERLRSCRQSVHRILHRDGPEGL
jgi:hypothetical protein